MTTMIRPLPSSYRDALRRARERAGALELSAARRVLEILREHAEDLARAVGALDVSTVLARREAAGASAEVARRTYERLRVRVEDAVASRRALAGDDVLAIWRAAAEDVAAHAGIPFAALGAVRTPPVTIIGAYERLGGSARTWRTGLLQHARGGAAEVDAIVSDALRRGLRPAELAKALRPYVEGARPFHEAFRGEAFQALRMSQKRLPPELRDAAGRVKWQSTRIAVSEINNARAEAEIQHYAADPLIIGVLWRTAPDRGKTRVPDICDVLEQTVWFEGMPPGFFYLDQVPVPPHPNDRCLRRPVVRDFSEAALPKPTGRRVAVDRIRLPKGFTERGGLAVRKELASLFAGSDAHPVNGMVRRVVAAAEGGSR